MYLLKFMYTMCMLEPVKARRGGRFPGNEVELPTRGAGNQTWIFCKSSKRP